MVVLITDCKMFICDSRRGYSVSKRLVKLPRFKSFSLQLSGHQDMPLLSFVRVASSVLIRCGWVFIITRSVENCISVERLNTLITDLQSVLQGSKKICGQPNKVYSLAYSQFCKAAKTLRPAKQVLVSVIPEAAVQINFAVNLARFFRTPISYYIDNHIKNPDHIILHAGTNDLRTENTASQIAKATIDLATSLKNDDNTVTVSGIVPRLGDLDNKANEVNRRLVLMCKERNISFLSHDESIDPSKHLNESKLHLNNSGIKIFAENFSKFLVKLN